MKNPKARWAIIAVIGSIALLALLRGLWVQIAVFGEGAYARLPDGRYFAEFNSYMGRKYFGGDRFWATFEIQDKRNNQLLWEYRIDGPESLLAIHGPKGKVSWSPDSSAVTFTAPQDEDRGKMFNLVARIQGSTITIE